jgi:RNA polymerase sigma-70 factor (ECF subfamily)
MECTRLSRDKEDVARELLALRCRRGDRTALEDLIRAWEARLLYFIRRLVRDEADAWDVLQETWMKVVKTINSLSDARSLSPWLYRVARITALRHIRSREPARGPGKSPRDVCR